MNRLLRPAAATALSLSVMLQAGCAWGFGGGDANTTEMHRQLSRTVSIQTGVVLGDMDRVQDAASWLAAHQERRAYPPDADTHRAEMRGYAALISQASDLGEVAGRTGQMAAACGSCHQALDAGPRFVLRSGPPEGKGPGARMVRLLWASDRMWEGLVGPSDSAWNAGVEVLDEIWLHGQTTASSPQYAASLLGIGGNISEIASAARSALTLEARAEIYGKMLNTCVRCHGTVGVMVER